jgi:hypothetical protein
VLVAATVEVEATLLVLVPPLVMVSAPPTPLISLTSERREPVVSEMMLAVTPIPARLMAAA